MTLLIHGKGKPYTLYVLKISTNPPQSWERRYRYSDLLLLHTYLQKTYPSLLNVMFPEKTFTVKKISSEVVDWRKFLLKKYLRFVINEETISKDPKVRQFLLE